MPMSKVCEFCGTTFSVKPAKQTQRFCSLACRQANRKAAHIEKECAECGTPFVITRKRESDRRFCSKECVTAHEARHGRPAARHERKETYTFECRQCGRPFSYKPGYLFEYRRKYGKDPMYCSMPCADLGRRADSDERNKATCKNCGKEFYRSRRKGSGTIYREQQLCSRQCKNEWVSKVYRDKHGLPEITKRIKRGYVVLRIPARDGREQYEILEHRYVMEQFLGRELLPTETVHHKRHFEKTNNSLDNLELFTSNHGPGGRVEEIVAWCIEMLTTYADFALRAGYRLVPYTEVAEVTPEAWEAVKAWQGQLHKKPT